MSPFSTRSIPAGSTDVDDSVLAIGTAYDGLGRVRAVTSYKRMKRGHH
jgi:hypothetical protein